MHSEDPREQALGDMSHFGFCEKATPLLKIDEEAPNPHEVPLDGCSNPFRPWLEVCEAEDYDGNEDKATTYWGVAFLDTACDVVDYLCNDNVEEVLETWQTVFKVVKLWWEREVLTHHLGARYAFLDAPKELSRICLSRFRDIPLPSLEGNHAIICEIVGPPSELYGELSCGPIQKNYYRFVTAEEVRSLDKLVVGILPPSIDRICTPPSCRISTLMASTTDPQPARGAANAQACPHPPLHLPPQVPSAGHEQGMGAK